MNGKTNLLVALAASFALAVALGCGGNNSSSGTHSGGGGTWDTLNDPYDDDTPDSGDDPNYDPNNPNYNPSDTGGGTPGGSGGTYPCGGTLMWQTNDSTILGREHEVFLLLNAHRRVNQRSPLTHNDSMRQLARGHCRHMQIHDFFAHDNPEGDSPFDRGRDAGVPINGENIARGYQSAQAAINGWINSPPHNSNMLNGSWGECGCGHWMPGWLWCQVFRP